METAKKNIEHILAKGSGTLINRCYALFCIIEEKNSNSEHLLKFLFENYGFIESDNTDPPLLEITKVEQEELRETYGDIVDGIIKSLIKRPFTCEEDFYAQLWKSITSPIFESKHAQVFALYYALIDKRLPYYAFGDGIKMTSDEWVERQKSMKVYLRKIKFILNNRNLFSQKTEVGSHLLEIIESPDEYENKVVLLTYLVEDLVDSDKDFSRIIEKIISR